MGADKETTQPRLTKADLEDPSLFRINSILSDLMTKTAEVSEQVAQKRRRIIIPTRAGAVGGGEYVDATMEVPTIVSATITQDGNQWRLSVSWEYRDALNQILPDVAFQVWFQVRLFSDAARTTAITDWVSIGSEVTAAGVTNHAEFGPYPVGGEEAWATLRARSVDGARVSNWAETNIVQTISPYDIGIPTDPPVAPTSVSATLINNDVDTFGVDTAWTMPASIGGTRDIEVFMQYYSDSGGSTPISDWILLGGADVNDNHLVSGFWAKPTSDVYARVQARALNILRDASAWVQSTVFLVPARGSWSWDSPNPPSSPTLTIVTRDNDTYGIISSWTPPADTSSIVAYDVQARFWLDAGLTQPDSDWILLGEQYPPETQLESGYWPMDVVDKWVKIRVRSRNGINESTAWVESASAALLPKAQPPVAPVYINVTLVGVDDVSYRVQVFFGPSTTKNAATRIYFQFFADAACTQPDGDKQAVRDSNLRDATPPYLYPMEEFGPWPRNIDDRWMKVGVSAVKPSGMESSITWYGTAIKIDKQYAPPAPQATALQLNEAIDGGVETFGFTVVPTAPPQLPKSYAAEVRFWKDAGLTVPDSGWILLGYIDPTEGYLTTDRWPKASYTTWAKARVASISEHDIYSEWMESNVVSITAGNLDLAYAKTASIGEGLQVSSGKLKTKLDTTRFTTDGSGQITTASNRDLPVIAASTPGSTYLGSNVVYFNGQVYTWNGVTYQPDANAAWVKQQLQSSGLTAAEFASGYAPVRIVNSVPGSYSGDFIVNTSDRKLYKWNGSAYVRPMQGADIKAELEVDKLTAAHIAAGAITTTQLAGNEIAVGPYSGLPPRFVVKDSGGVTIGAIGEFSGFTGLWAANGRFGGSFSSPIINLTSSGATISNASIITNTPYGSLEMSPTNGFKMSSGSAYAQLYYYQLAMNSGGAGSAIYGNLGIDISNPAGGSVEIGAEFYSSYSYCRIGNVTLDSSPSLKFGSSTLIDSSRNADFVTLKIGGTQAIDSSRHAYFQSLSISGSSVIDSNRYASFQRLTVGGKLWFDETGKIRFWDIQNESIFLGGITSTKWIPAYYSDGTFAGKIPLI